MVQILPCQQTKIDLNQILNIRAFDLEKIVEVDPDFLMKGGEDDNDHDHETCTDPNHKHEKEHDHDTCTDPNHKHEKKEKKDHEHKEKKDHEHKEKKDHEHKEKKEHEHKEKKETNSSSRFRCKLVWICFGRRV